MILESLSLVRAGLISSLGGGAGAKFKLNQETAAPKVESHEQQYSRTD